ncbi:MAG: PH domain-containing protein [Acidobacteriota bacterium]
MGSIQSQLQPGEKILYRTQPTRVGLYTGAILLVFVALAAAATFEQTGEGIWVVVGGLLGAALLLSVIREWIVVQSNHYLLTDRRVMKQSGIVSKRSVTAYLDKLNNVDHTITLWGRILGYGDVEVDTASETGVTVFARVPRPIEFQRAILSAADNYRSHGFAPQAASPQTTGADRLRQLKSLLDDGLISAEEFEERRKEIVAGL